MKAVLSLLESDTRATILVRRDRLIIGFNRAARELFPGLAPNADLAVDPNDTAVIDSFLRRCAGTRGPIPGALPLTANSDGSWHVDGGLLAAASEDTPAIVVLRVRPRAEGRREFAALTQKIEELNRDLHTRRRLQSNLEESVRNQEVLLQEVHHRVKNNLQVVSSMLSLALGARDPRMALSQAVDRVRAIAAVHELLYAQPRFTHMDGAALLRAVTAGLSEMYGRHQIAIEVADTTIDIPAEHTTALALIVTELVTNAYKHAFDDAGAGIIRIALTKNGTTATLLVGDDGVPFPATRQGTGLRIVDAFVRKLGGTLEVVSNPKHICVAFPVER
jgi:two-component sensor histidine kinase